jgi:hypothetical protein
LPRIEAFIPISESILALTGLVTAAFLLVVFRRSRLRAVLCLASGYLFISLMTLPLMLAAPGVLLSSDPFGADPQTGAWLDTFHQAGFPVFVSSYALLRRYEVASGRLHKGAPADFIWAGTGAVAAVCLLTLFAVIGRGFRPSGIWMSSRRFLAARSSSSRLFRRVCHPPVGERIPGVQVRAAMAHSPYRRLQSCHAIS